jgi:hypothetical protein
MEWNQLVIDFDQLSAETLWLVDQIREGKSIQELEKGEYVTNQEIEKPSVFPLEEEKNVGPQVEGPGLLYFIDFQGRTFSVRGLASKDLRIDYKLALKGDQTILDSLRVSGEKESASIQIFRTPSFETAEMIVDQIANRRFPIEEESYLNVSDPGPGLWFFDRGENEFSLSFKRIFRQGGKGAISIGPLFDPKVAERRFRNLPSTLLEWSANDQLELDDRGITMKSNQNKKIILCLKDILIDGRMTFQPGDFKPTHDGRTLYLFLLELAFIRRFWLEIENSFPI